MRPIAGSIKPGSKRKHGSNHRAAGGMFSVRAESNSDPNFFSRFAYPIFNPRDDSAAAFSATRIARHDHELNSMSGLVTGTPISLANLVAQVASQLPATNFSGVNLISALVGGQQLATPPMA